MGRDPRVAPLLDRVQGAYEPNSWALSWETRQSLDEDPEQPEEVNKRNPDPGWEARTEGSDIASMGKEREMGSFPRKHLLSPH